MILITSTTNAICVQVVNARASLAQELHERTKPIEEDRPEKSTSESNDSNDSRHEEIVSVPSTGLSANVLQEMCSDESSTSTAEPVPATKKQSVLSTESQVAARPVVEGILVTQSNVGKKPVISNEIQIVDKPVVEGGIATHKKVEKQVSVSTSKLEQNDWLKEESAECEGVRKTTIRIENEEDVSFSDLEEDDV